MLDVLIVPSMVLAPAAFWGLYHYYKDRRRPEPPQHLLLTYLLGILAGIVCLWAYAAVELLGLPDDPLALAGTSRLGFLGYTIGVVGLLEELAKFLPFWLVCLRLRSFDEPLDGIVYASVVALGFATYENVIYARFLGGGELLARAVASPIVHCLFASIWGYAVGRARCRGDALLTPALWSLGVAIAAHGLYDFLVVGASPLLRIVPALIVLVIWIWRIRLVGRLQRS